MGAWNYGIFDDDSAYDALDELMESENILLDMEKSFDAVSTADEIDYDEAYFAIISAAVMDMVLNSTEYDAFVDEEGEEVAEWLNTLDADALKKFKEKAILAIDAILSDGCELRQLWEENEELYPLWVSDKQALKERLQK